MYNVGDKFIIEIDEVFTGKATGHPQYRIKGFDSLIINDRGLEKLSMPNYYMSIFSKGYEAGKQAAIENGSIASYYKDITEAYNKGLNVAWEAAKKLCQSIEYGGLEEYCSEIFGKHNEMFDVFDYTASEAIAKIKAYEDKQKQDAEIKVGDEVILNANATHENEKAIVLAYSVKVRLYNVLINDGSTAYVKEDAIGRKTGRHFPQIAELLAEIGGK